MNNNIRPLSPFQNFCIKFLGYVPSSYDDCMTYLECLIYTYNYLKNEIVPTVEQQNVVVQELKDYVEHYFDNLDVQEEINNKLDAMALDGTLEEIITEYIQLKGVLAYDKIADMKVATNLVSGSFVQTYGFHAKNDGGGAKYIVRPVTNEDIVDEMTIFALDNESLVAELIIDSEMFVEQFGAYGDNTHDDYQSISKAIEKCNKIILNNTYKSNTLISVSNKDDISLSGKGKINSDKPVILSFSNCNNLGIKNLKFESSYDINASESVREQTPDTNGYTTLSSIIRIDVCSNPIIDNVEIIGGYTGLYASNSNIVKVTNSKIHGARHICLCCSTSQFMIENNEIYDVDCDYTDQYANYLIQATDNENYDNQKYSILKNNVLHDNKNWDAFMSHMFNNLIITGNHIYEVRSGIDLSAESDETIPAGFYKNVIITDNVITGTSTDVDNSYAHLNVGITFDSVSQDIYNVVISNNIIENFCLFTSTSYSTINLHGNHKASITGNIIKSTNPHNSAYLSCIRTGGNCSDLNISNNTLESALAILRIDGGTLNRVNFTNNIVYSTGNNNVISVTDNATINDLSFDNYVPTDTGTVRIASGCTVNGITYSSTEYNLYYNKGQNAYISETYSGTISANSAVTKNVTLTGVKSTDSYIVTIQGTGSNSIFAYATYGASNTLTLHFVNFTSASVSANLNVKVIRYSL